MKNLVKHVQNMNAQYDLWHNGDTIVVGVSGGPDSMCLLDILSEIALKTDLTIIVAHVNYGLRGEDSDKDQKLVEKYTKERDIVCEIFTCNDAVENNENAWRKVRYDFFADIAQKYFASCTVVAHTKNDQAETLLLHLLRGSGLRGLSGMQVCSENNIVRPLLFIGRDDVLSYCTKKRVSYNVDVSNMDNVFMRNKIRNELIPYMKEEFNPKIVDVLSGAATIIADDHAFLEKQNIVFWQKKDEENRIIFDTKDFLCKHNSLQRMALRTMIIELNGELTDIESGFVKEMQKAIASTKNKHQKVSGKNLKMLRKGDTVELIRIH